jgi:hypothetical protein
MMYALIPATPDHARAMAPHLRTAEVQEVMAASGLTPEQTLLAELAQSLVAWAWLVDGQVGCMFGVVQPSLLDEESYPWFLTTALVEQHARQFARCCKQLLPELLRHYPKLIGQVDARYRLSIRWLTWLGATLQPAAPYGVAGLPFHRFTLGV